MKYTLQCKSFQINLQHIFQLVGDEKRSTFIWGRRKFRMKPDINVLVFADMLCVSASNLLFMSFFIATEFSYNIVALYSGTYNIQLLRNKFPLFHIIIFLCYMSIADLLCTLTLYFLRNIKKKCRSTLFSYLFYSVPKWSYQSLEQDDGKIKLVIEDDNDHRYLPSSITDSFDVDGINPFLSCSSPCSPPWSCFLLL